MGVYKAWSTMEVVAITGKKRSSVLKRLHKLESVKIVEKRIDSERRFYWLVKFIPERPPAPKLWRESKSIYELVQDDITNGPIRCDVTGCRIHSTRTSGSSRYVVEGDGGRTDATVSEGYNWDQRN